MARFARALAERLLLDDVPDDDLTTLALGLEGKRGRMQFRARHDLVVAGIEVAATMIKESGADVTVFADSGTFASQGTMLLSAEGPACSLHASWKTSQTLVEYLSGIATATRILVDAVAAKDNTVRVATTRKTPPGPRPLYVSAIRAGGAISHRLGLSETILVFPEHLAFLPNVSLVDIAKKLRWQAPEKKIAIEVKTLAEASQALKAGFDVIQLEKMTPPMVASVREIATAEGSLALLAAAGGISPDNASAYVAAGAGLIVSSWPYTAKPAEVAVSLTPQS